MKAHTSEFKNQIKEFGREIDSIISYELNGETIELGNENLNSVTPHYKGTILKSVMKQLDIDSNVDIPIGTVLNYQFGVKVRDNEIDEEIENDYRINYDYINFGNYIVKESEKQEDTGSYTITCYDKMLYSMVDYENMNIQYPITVRDYISTICNHLGLVFKNANSIFANYNKEISGELYLTYNEDTQQWESIGYTFRDVLDELAQATASTICINEDDDKLEVRYITDTNDTVDEEYLKDINVNFGVETKPINTIVLSRAGGSDKVYLSQPIDLADEAKVAIEISDNQIMGFNNRSDYLSDILNKLYGLTYSLNDYSSTGICYYNLCDRYNISITKYDDENETSTTSTYSCVMFNDEINITQGLEENIHTDLLEESETDYTKADKTDRKINQTYLIVDKQNQVIEGVSSRVTEQDEKIAQIRLQYDEIMSKVSDVADITVSAESTVGNVRLNGVNASYPISIKIHPTLESIKPLYPRQTLHPSNDNHMIPNNRILRFTNLDTSEIFDWSLPTDLYITTNHETYDELELAYGDGSDSNVIVIRRCEINQNGNISAKETPTTETYPYPTSLFLTTGDYRVEMITRAYGTSYLFVQLMAANIYTTQFYTKSETNSIIDQTADEIDLSVNQKLSNYSTTNEMNSAINIKANEISSTVSETYATKTTTNTLSSRIAQTAKNITLQVNNGSTTSGITIGITKENGETSTATGTINMTGLVKFSNLRDGTTTISGSNIKTGTINANNVAVTNLNASNITSGTISANKISGGTIDADNITVKNLTASNISRGSLSGIPLTYNAGSSSGGTVKVGSTSDGPLTGYYNGSYRWALAAFPAGGKLQVWNSGGHMAYAYDQRGPHASSDIRYKKNIKNIKEKESINIITNLTPISYTRDSEQRNRGLSAQEVEKILKENGIENQIYEIDKKGDYTLNYLEFIPDLINCIKYQQKEINSLKKEMEEIRNAKDNI